ncbi:MAG: permease-like cell division protein FtsX [Syntrophomonadaceae bacterium]|nr:permease-like cell division protein FtsX [Syntrophomonadaceae bacterium]
MKPANAIYFIREATQSLSRNRVLSFATITTVAVSILILGIALLMTVNTGNIMNRLESDVQVIAFLDKTLTSGEISTVKRNIEKIDGVKSLKFVPRDEALKKLQESYGKDYDLKATIGKNPLPNTFDVKAKDPHQVPVIANKINKINGVYKVNYGQGVVERLFQVTRWVRIVSIAFIVLLAAGAVFLIATTIRLAIFARRKEIYLMKLIGATDWFVRWPFFIEGMFMGISGSLIAVLLLALGYNSLVSRIGTVFFMPLVSDPHLLSQFYFSLIGIGALLGMLGTYISINRFLKV